MARPIGSGSASEGVDVSCQSTGPTSRVSVMEDPFRCGLRQRGRCYDERPACAVRVTRRNCFTAGAYECADAASRRVVRCFDFQRLPMALLRRCMICHVASGERYERGN